jgi:hypothetical protein
MDEMRISYCEMQEEFMALADELDLDITKEMLKDVSGGYMLKWRWRVN